jgi:hypothetical protein
MLGDGGGAELSMEFASGAYEASTLVGAFRPAFVVVDEDVLSAGRSDLLDCLAKEARIPGLKVILAVSRHESLRVPNFGTHIDGFIRKPFDSEQLAAFLDQVNIERVSEGG